MIGGNTTVDVQISETTKNEIGESVKTWDTVQTLAGWLDYQSGDSRYTTYNAKLQESTHLFICDYTPLDPRIKSENSRLLIDGKRYDVLLIDDPMGINAHYEFYLKFTGGQ